MGVSINDELENDDFEDLLTYEKLSRGMEVNRYKVSEEEPSVTEEGYFHKVEDESYQEF